MGEHTAMQGNEVLHHRRDSIYCGICVDTGAEACVAGLCQRQAYLERCKMPQEPLKQGSKICKFADCRKKDLGVGAIRICADDDGNFIELNCYVIDADIPILLGLDVMVARGMNIMIESMNLETKQWAIPMMHKAGHLHCGADEMEAMLAEDEAISILRSKSELQSLHKKFGHAEAEKLCSAMKRAGKDVAQ